MRRFAMLRTVTPVLALLTMSVAACGDDFQASDVATPTGAGGGGTTSTGQGSGGSAGGGGSGGDGSISGIASSASASASSSSGAGGSEPAPMPTSILVVDQHDNPRGGVVIAVNDALGAVVETTLSNGAGQAQVLVPDGGSVSVFYTVDEARFVESVLDVPAGGVVRFATRLAAPAPPAPPLPTTYNIVVQGLPPETSWITLESNCISYTGTGTILALDNTGCTDVTEQDFLVTAFTWDGKHIAWGAAFKQPTKPGLNAFVAIDVTHSIFKPVVAQIVNVPPRATSGTIDIVPARIGADLHKSSTQPHPFLSLSGFAPSGLADLAEEALPHSVSERLGWSIPGADAWISRSRDYATLPDAPMLDASALAHVATLALDAADPVHPVIGWTLDGGPLGEEGSAQVIWSLGASSGSYRARFAGDHASPIRVPDMPAELSTFAPSGQVTFHGWEVRYTDHETAAGYADGLDGVTEADGLGSVQSGATRTDP